MRVHARVEPRKARRIEPCGRVEDGRVEHVHRIWEAALHTLSAQLLTEKCNGRRARRKKLRRTGSIDASPRCGGLMLGSLGGALGHFPRIASALTRACPPSDNAAGLAANVVLREDDTRVDPRAIVPRQESELVRRAMAGATAAARQTVAVVPKGRVAREHNFHCRRGRREIRLYNLLDRGTRTVYDRVAVEEEDPWAFVRPAFEKFENCTRLSPVYGRS